MKTKFLLAFVLVYYSNEYICAQSYLIQSPSNTVQMEVSVGDELSYSVYYKGNRVLQPSTLKLEFSDAPEFGNMVRVIDSKQTSVDNTWSPAYGNFSKIRDHYNQLTLEIEEKLFPQRTIVFQIKAFDDGIAFRYQIPESWKRFIISGQPGGRLNLLEEKTSFNFTADHEIWMADYGSFTTHQETEFQHKKISAASKESIIGLPMLAKINDRLYAAITEADLTDWAGMYLLKGKDYSFQSLLSPLPGGNNIRVKVLPGSFSPWRLIMLGESPGRLIESEIINNLNDPCEIADPSWISPGISAWDHWWSGEVKMDTKTIKEYIDLSAEMGWEYMLIDWHWYGAPFLTNGEFRADPDADLTTVNPDVDMPGVIEYAKKKGVKLVLWLLWNHVDKQMDEAFALYEKWGISGVKIDFMARDDQEMVNWYQKVVKKAAEHKLVVDFHGAYKPTGWSRTYPNLITREGVMGNEYSKWSSRITPEHNVTLPFTRMLAGHMDYTPGAFLNVTARDFRNGSPTEVMNTRCHQLAMFVVYYSPFTVACDHPDNYKKQPGINFLKEVPTVWDDTKVLSGEVGDHIVMARKNGNRWYIGAMNNSIEKGITIKLDFLPKGNYSMKVFKDAQDSNLHPDKLVEETETVSGGQYYFIKMAPGGGFAGYINLK